jgi:Polyketide cyclase / dehydrase and lipid transport
MSRRVVSASMHISAPPSLVYTIIADYHNGHPRILPRPPFVSLVVEEGGIGAGTRISVQMRLMGRVRTFLAAITEPEPGWVLRETIFDTGVVTSFTVEPLEGGRQSHVTISTEMEVHSGVVGKVQGWLIGRLFRPVYVKELALLAAVAVDKKA